MAGPDDTEVRRCLDKAAARAERQQHLQAILEEMDSADREVLALRPFEQLSTAEAAQFLGVSEEAAKGRHLRALARLHKALAAEPCGREG
jgi:RNA polymerase sigma factor (sigma-70 family)